MIQTSGVDHVVLHVDDVQRAEPVRRHGLHRRHGWLRLHVDGNVPIAAGLPARSVPLSRHHRHFVFAYRLARV